MHAGRTQDVSHERVSHRAINIEAHDTGVVEVFDNANSKMGEPLTHVTASNTSVERPRVSYLEDTDSSGALGVGDIDMDVGVSHPITESTLAFPVTPKVLDASRTRTSELPLRVLLREQEEHDQEALAFSPLLDKPSQDELTRITNVAPIGANNEPLGTVARKRSAPDSEEVPRASKFRMTESVALTKTTTVHDGLLIDLTIPGKYIPPHRRQPVLSNITNTQKRGNTVDNCTNGKAGKATSLTWNQPDSCGKESRPPRSRRASAVATENVTRVEPTNPKVSPRKTASEKAFTKVFNRLIGFRTGLIKDRENLSTRWEADDKMKEPEMMDRMQLLGDYMRQIDEALAGAIEVVSQIK